MERSVIEGEVIWLTAEQGGRETGPPKVEEFQATAFVPPHTIDNGLASFFLKDFESGAWRSSATGGWLVVENEGAQTIAAQSLVVVTEGRRPVAYFHAQGSYRSSSPAPDG